MMNKSKIINQAINAASDKSGFEFQLYNYNASSPEGLFEYSDGNLEVTTLNSTVLNFSILIKQELREYQFAELLKLSGETTSLMFIADKISSPLKKKLRDWKIGYIDTAGNMFINVPNFFLWIDGQKNIESSILEYNRAFTKTGLKLIFYLLINNEAANMPYRKLSEAAGVSTGNITNVMNGLTEAGFLIQGDSKRYILQRKKTLLTRWISGYAEILRPSLLLGRYRTRVDNWKDLPTKRAEDFWGGEPAAELITNYMKPQDLILYTNQSKGEEIQKLRLAFGHNSGNLILFKKFWNDPDLDKEWHVPFLLIYADLVLTDDPRCIEVAEMIYKQYLKDEFDEPERKRTEAGN